MKDATSSDESEVLGMNPVLPESVRDGIRHDTASSQVEIDALMRRLRQLEPERMGAGGALWRPALIGGGLLLAGVAAAAGVAVVAPSLIASPAPEAPAMLALSGDTSHALTESIEVSGLAELRVDRVHADGAEVTLVDGVAHFAVDPEGARRALSVAAGDVGIEVFGTVFTVERSGQDVLVQVERGEVGVRWNGESFPVLTGQSWRRGEGIVAATPADAIEASAPELSPAGGGLVDDIIDAYASHPEAPAPPAVRPTAAARPAVVEGTTEDPEAAASVAESASVQDPCEIDSFSPQCARSRLRNRASSPESRYQAMRDARAKVAYNAGTARTLVDNANQFLDQFPESAYADDVRAFRVEGAFYGSRASQTISFADAFLASAPKEHRSVRQVEQWRRIATLRRDVIDSAQRDCAEADPHLAELIRLETGLRKDEARAHRGLCAFQLDERDRAQEILRTIENEERLPVSLKAQVREAWTAMRAPARER